MYQNLWAITKEVLRGKFVVLSAFSRKIKAQWLKILPQHISKLIQSVWKEENNTDKSKY